jgi:3-oxoadipate enol-lactonase
MPFARASGIALHYDVSGSKDLPPLVFSNSLGTDLRIWNDVAERLSNRFRIVRYDKRGHGLSEATPPPYQLTDHVGDLTGLLDHLQIKRTAIVGLSVGGLIAQGLAALHPERVAALVLSDTAHKIGTDESWNDRIELVGRKGLEAIIDRVMPLWFTAAFRKPDNPNYTGYRNMFLRTPVDGYLGTCAAIRDADLTESTRALALPTLCVVGAEDGSTPVDLVRSMANLIRNSEFRIIPGAAHIPCVEQPDAFTSLVGGWLRGTHYG